MNRLYRCVMLVLVSVLVAACSNQPNEEIMQGASPVQLRSFQTRAFDTSDKLLMLRSVVATLQDLGFIIDEANVDLGSVTGTKVSGSQIRITVVVRPRGDAQLLVRANAYFDLKPIEDPEPYQDFFTSLEKAVFLTAHQVD
ncbi:MAG: hypothetical protein H6985_04660 [Pseudomonadales bacterium]|nr:hypothetical protein [Pseudomonadales bacterium]